MARVRSAAGGATVHASGAPATACSGNSRPLRKKRQRTAMKHAQSAQALSRSHAPEQAGAAQQVRAAPLRQRSAPADRGTLAEAKKVLA
jgi:hypothetical protein